jgi:hypothetical protein
VIKLYGPSPNSCLFVAPTAQNMVGRVPIIPLILVVNSTLTIARIQASRLASLMQLLWMEGKAAMSVRLICGCGSLGAASPCSRLQQERCERCTKEACSRDKTALHGGLIQSKMWNVSPQCDCISWYVQVCIKSIKI